MCGEIEALTAKCGLTDTVRITGWISSEEGRAEILATRALVLPSFAEGLPVVIMEAMALRRPVITTFVAGIPELIRHGEHGWLVPAGDLESLAGAMEECLRTEPEAITRMQRHDVDKEAAKLAELIEA
jgi:colanic acid/amylovoran biosynthesis glycosyltransferase